MLHKLMVFTFAHERILLSWPHGCWYGVRHDGIFIEVRRRRCGRLLYIFGSAHQRSFHIVLTLATTGGAHIGL